jgi:hypothetical protein
MLMWLEYGSSIVFCLLTSSTCSTGLRIRAVISAYLQVAILQQARESEPKNLRWRWKGVSSGDGGEGTQSGDGHF